MRPDVYVFFCHISPATIENFYKNMLLSHCKKETNQNKKQNKAKYIVPHIPMNEHGLFEDNSQV